MHYDSSIYWDIVLKRETFESAIEKCKDIHGLKWTNEYIITGTKTGKDYVLENLLVYEHKLYIEKVLCDHNYEWFLNKCKEKHGSKWMDKHIFIEKQETFIYKYLTKPLVRFLNTIKS